MIITTFPVNHARAQSNAEPQKQYVPPTGTEFMRWDIPKQEPSKAFGPPTGTEFMGLDIPGRQSKIKREPEMQNVPPTGTEINRLDVPEQAPPKLASIRRGDKAFAASAVFFTLVADAEPPGLLRANAYYQFLQHNSMEAIICSALTNLFSLETTSQCLDRQSNSDHTVFVQVYISDEVRKLFEIEIFGKSEILALHIPSFNERHRLYIAFGYDGAMIPYLTVYDFEPLFRSYNDLLDSDEHKFEYVERDKADRLRAFQDKIKSAITVVVQREFDKAFPR
jgi:hypothetical protein